MKNKVWIVAVVAILAIAGGIVYYALNSEENEAGTSGEEINVTLLINFGNGTVWNYSIPVAKQNATVFNVLLEAASQGGWSIDYTYYGQYDSYFVNSIAGEGGNGKYWIYYVNGEMGEVAADKKMLQGGDEVEWKLEEFS